ncbi:hypothetical protein AAMO2058_001473500 [Amorphochlora amoebiformis]
MDPKSQQHAQHLWGFLDDLAEKDPAGYKKFMEEKMREAKKFSKASKAKNAPPRPKYVVSSKLQGTSQGSRSIYMNFMTSPRCPELQKKDGSKAGPRTPISELVVPISVGELAQHKGHGSPYTYVDVTFHPSTIERGQKDLAVKLYLVEVALTHVEEDHKIKISRAYKLEPEGKYKGDYQLRYKPRRNPAASNPTCVQAGEARAGGLVLPEGIAKVLGGVPASRVSPSAPTHVPTFASTQTAKKPKGPLIVDITKGQKKSTERSHEVSEGVSTRSVDIESKPKLCESEGVSVETVIKGEIPQAVVRIRLMRAESVVNLIVDVSSTVVQVTGSGYDTTISFPFPVDNNLAKAKFSKKKRLLTIRAPRKT